MQYRTGAIRQRLVEAEREQEADDALWTYLATGQDTEEAEHSGYLIGRAEALREVLALLQS